ncbi:MAG: hypothetical protein V9G14_07480 [Cypionkella sp.]
MDAADAVVQKLPPGLGAEMLVLAQPGEARAHLFGLSSAGRRLHGGFVDHQAFGRHAFGIDDLVPVKHHD